MKIKLYDKILPSTAQCFASGRRKVKPDNFEWYRGEEYCDISVFTDQSLNEVSDCESLFKVALLVESPEIFPKPYNNIVGIYDMFDIVLTFDQRLLDLGKNFRPYELGGCWLAEKDWHIYNKTKKISMIASRKNTTIGHKLRHQVYKEFGDKVDIYGGITDNRLPYVDKIHAYKDYAFCVVIENCKRKSYFTEKLIECFLTGTMPIYWGCPGITPYASDSYFFNSGILVFNTVKELNTIIEGINNSEAEQGISSWYYAKGEAIVKNFYQAMNYTVMENRIWHYFEELIKLKENGIKKEGAEFKKRRAEKNES